MKTKEIEGLPKKTQIKLLERQSLQLRLQKHVLREILELKLSAREKHAVKRYILISLYRTPTDILEEDGEVLVSEWLEKGLAGYREWREGRLEKLDRKTRKK